ncbi:hypothetical protein JX266_009164 [Neoarthrinium moseri]|nr:hypothetical protein JX266_009164 [Neoarthrinium moseri]
MALCCPSRASLLTGKAGHNTNVTDVKGPYGGYDKFVAEGFNDRYLPVWLQDAGYSTWYIGKLFNSHNPQNYNKPFPAAWNGSDFLLDPYQYSYFSPMFQRNEDAPVLHNGSYVTDLLAEKSFGFLDDAVTAGKPFFLTMAPIAPHSQVDTNLTTLLSSTSAPQPKPEHANLFLDAKVPRAPNFNPEFSSGASWVKTLPRLNATQVENNDKWHRSRLQSLQSVDSMVDQLFLRLEQHGIIDNTYVFFTSDNGYHIGHHRMAPGKTCGYEEDTNVPLIVRGPGVPAGARFKSPTSMTDLAPTFVKIAGKQPQVDFDGVAIPLTEVAMKTNTRHEHVNIEFWRLSQPGEGGVRNTTQVANTYKSLRIVSTDYSFYYSVWCTNEHDLYDMTSDPYQLNNVFKDGFNSNSSSNIVVRGTSVPVSRLASRLDGLLMVLKSCSGISCRDPWGTLDPTGRITSLLAALSPEYDEFFNGEIPRISFDECKAGYLVEFEGPQYTTAYQLRPRDGQDPDWAINV